MNGGGINDKNTPVDLPHNEFTEMIERVRERNIGGGVALPPPRESGGDPCHGGPSPGCS